MTTARTDWTGRAWLAALCAPFLVFVLALGGGVGRRAEARTPPPPPSPPIAVGRVYNKLTAANVNILPADLAPFGGAVPAYDEASVAYRVTIALVTTASVVEVQLVDATNGTTVEADLTLPDGTTTTIPAGKMCTCLFAVPYKAQVGAGAGTSEPLTVNFQCETLTTVGMLVVEELHDGVGR